MLTACGIETRNAEAVAEKAAAAVATVLTACGIETWALSARFFWLFRCNSAYRLRY